MYAIFIQGRTGLDWVGNEATIDAAKMAAEAYRYRDGVDFVIVTPLAYFIDADGEREFTDD